MNAPDPIEHFLMVVRSDTPRGSSIDAHQWYRYWKLRYQERFPASTSQDYDRFINGLTAFLGV